MKNVTVIHNYPDEKPKEEEKSYIVRIKLVDGEVIFAVVKYRDSGFDGWYFGFYDSRITHWWDLPEVIE